MRFLVDGYNLLHAIGLGQRSMTAKGLQRAREKLLDWLADTRGDREADIHVVFDGTHLGGPVHHRRGISFEFSRGKSADDRLAELLAESRQSAVVAVSNDNQVRESALRSQCDAWLGSKFVDWLLEKPLPEKEPDFPHRDEKGIKSSPEELAELLQIFESKPIRKKGD